MRKHIAICAAAVLLSAPALAQSTSPSQQMNRPGQTVESGQSSGAGVQGLPGNKSGPPARSPSGTTGAGNGQQPAGTTYDASKTPSLPGPQGGPSVKSPDGK